MSTWNTETIRQLFDSFSVAGAPDDPKEIKRQRIVGAASSLFEQFGYRKTSIDDVAKSAGVAKGTVYLYAKTKADLMVQVIMAEKIKHFEEIKTIFDEADPALRIKKWVELIFVIGKKMPITSRLMRGDQEIYAVLAEMDPQMKEQSDQMGQAFLGWMIDEAAGTHRWNAQELADRAKTLYGIAYASGVMLDYAERTGLSVERFASLLSEMIVDGIAHPQQNSEGRTK